MSVLSRSTSQGSALSTQASGTSFAPLPVRDGDDVAAIVAATRASIRPALVLQELAEKGLHAAQRKQAARYCDAVEGMCGFVVAYTVRVPSPPHRDARLARVRNGKLAWPPGYAGQSIAKHAFDSKAYDKGALPPSPGNVPPSAAAAAAAVAAATRAPPPSPIVSNHKRLRHPGGLAEAMNTGGNRSPPDKPSTPAQAGVLGKLASRIQALVPGRQPAAAHSRGRLSREATHIIGDAPAAAPASPGQRGRWHSRISTSTTLESSIDARSTFLSHDRELSAALDSSAVQTDAWRFNRLPPTVALLAARQGIRRESTHIIAPPSSDEGGGSSAWLEGSDGEAGTTEGDGWFSAAVYAQVGGGGGGGGGGHGALNSGDGGAGSAATGATLEQPSSQQQQPQVASSKSPDGSTGATSETAHHQQQHAPPDNATATEEATRVALIGGLSAVVIGPYFGSTDTAEGANKPAQQQQQRRTPAPSPPRPIAQHHHRLQRSHTSSSVTASATLSTSLSGTVTSDRASKESGSAHGSVIVTAATASGGSDSYAYGSSVEVRSTAALGTSVEVSSLHRSGGSAGSGALLHTSGRTRRKASGSEAASANMLQAAAALGTSVEVSSLHRSGDSAGSGTVLHSSVRRQRQASGSEAATSANMLQAAAAMFD